MAEKKKPTPKRTRQSGGGKTRETKGHGKIEARDEATSAKAVERSQVSGPSPLPVQVLKPVLKEEIFGARVHHHLLHQVVAMQLNNRRAGTASSKTKGFVRGGGKKPWRQKGTGRARAGSIRSPLWVGGGTIFGPKPRDYSYRLPRKARREALLSALSLKNRDGKIIVLDRLELAEAKTKLMRKMLEDLKVKNALIVIPQPDEKVERSARNLPTVKVLRAEGLNVYDLLRYEHLILTEGAMKLLEERLAA